MGFNSDGSYTAPTGATNAFAGQTIASATWNAIFTDIQSALTTLGQNPVVNAQTGASYAFLATDRGKYVTFSNGGATAVTLSQATGNFAKWFVYAENLGAGAVTITPTTSTIGGSATLVLAQNQSALVISDGANYQVLPKVTGSGATVLATSPTLTSPALVTPTLGAATLTTLNANVSSTNDPIIAVNTTATIVDRTHSFQANSQWTFNTNGATGDASFDDETSILGTANTINHHASFQAFPIYKGSGVLSGMYSLNSSPSVNGTGTLSILAHINIQDAGASGGGSITNQYGLFVPSLTGATTKNRAILVQTPTVSEFQGPLLTAGPVNITPRDVTLVNGLNSNITIPISARGNVTGPSGAFSVGGFVAPSLDGFRIYLFNTTAQTMTIVNEDGSSTAANRIKTLTGGNVVLRANATSFATLSYDNVYFQRWILESTN